MPLRRYKTRAIRQLLMAAYNLEELRTLCFDEFRPVYEDYNDVPKSELIRRLIEFCERKGVFERLLTFVEEDVPAKYAEYQSRLWVEEATPPDSRPEPRPSRPSLSLTLAASPSNVETGQEVTWTATLDNDGDDTLRSIVVRRGLTLLDQPFSLAAGESRIFTFTSQPQTAGEHQEQVAVTGVASNGQNVTDQTSLTVPVSEPAPELRPSLALSLTAEPQTVEAGQEVAWQVSLRNNGNDDLRSVVAQHERTLLANPFDLAAGKGRDFTFTTRPSSKGQHSETVTATGLASSGQKVTDAAEASVQVNPPPPKPKPQPNLTCHLSAAPEVVEAGSKVTWTFKLYNTGSDTLRSVTVQHERTLLADPFDLPVGERRKFTFSTTPQREGQKTETVKVTALASSDRSLRDEASAAVRVTAPPAPPAAKPKRQQKPPPKTQLKDVLAITKPIKMEFVRIPAGQFLMGSDPAKDKYARKNEQPQHKVHLPDYYIGKYPVTNVQYATFLEATGHKAADEWFKKIKTGFFFSTTEFQFPRGVQNHPAVYVSWDDAVTFCRWLSQETSYTIRLPSEAEWEKAARGTDGRIFPWGDQWPTKELCNFGGNEGGTTPVGHYPKGASPYGVLDMAGNVWEWCSTIVEGDWSKPGFKPYPYQVEDEWSAAYLDRTNIFWALRGGSWGGNEEGARCACRDRYVRGFRSSCSGRGVRLVLVSPI